MSNLVVFSGNKGVAKGELHTTSARWSHEEILLCMNDPATTEHVTVAAWLDRPAAERLRNALTAAIEKQLAA